MKAAHLGESKPLFLWRQCGRGVRALALRSGDPGFKTRSDHSFNLFLVVPGSTSQLHLYIANWFASCQLGFLTVQVVVLYCFVDCVSLALKSPYGERSIKYVCMYVCISNLRCLAAIPDLRKASGVNLEDKSGVEPLGRMAGSQHFCPAASAVELAPSCIISSFPLGPTSYTERGTMSYGQPSVSLSSLPGLSAHWRGHSSGVTRLRHNNGQGSLPVLSSD